MTDFRKFCWGLFVGMGAAAMMETHGWLLANADRGAAIIVTGLTLGCLTVINLGRERVDK